MTIRELFIYDVLSLLLSKREEKTLLSLWEKDLG
jgi:hypothetical protein